MGKLGDARPTAFGIPFISQPRTLELITGHNKPSLLGRGRTPKAPSLLVDSAAPSQRVKPSLPSSRSGRRNPTSNRSHKFNNITGGSNFATDGPVPRRKCNGLVVERSPTEEAAAPTSARMSDSPDKMSRVSFPTRCSTQLAAEVYSCYGRCPSP